MPSSALTEELGVPWECGCGAAGGGAVHDPGGGEAAPPGAVGLRAGRATAAECRRDGSGIAAAGPVGGEPSGACAAASAGRVAAASGAAEGDPRAAAGPEEGVRV